MKQARSFLHTKERELKFVLLKFSRKRFGLRPEMHDKRPESRTSQRKEDRRCGQNYMFEDYMHDS